MNKMRSKYKEIKTRNEELVKEVAECNLKILDLLDTKH